MGGLPLCTVIRFTGPVAVPGPPVFRVETAKKGSRERVYGVMRQV
jgi:hypothetical protein